MAEITESTVRKVLDTVIDPVTGDPQVDPKEKEKIVTVVEHEGKVLTIKWPTELGGRLLVGGTVNEGEDPAVK